MSEKRRVGREERRKGRKGGGEDGTGGEGRRGVAHDLEINSVDRIIITGSSVGL